MSLSISKAALVSNNMKQFPADLVTSAEEKLMEKFIFRAVLRDLQVLNLSFSTRQKDVVATFYQYLSVRPRNFAGTSQLKHPTMFRWNVTMTSR